MQWEISGPIELRQLTAERQFMLFWRGGVALPFVALQYAFDLIGQMLDDLVRRENFEIRFRSGQDRTGWIWLTPPH